jgi:hypothetical protein
MSVRLKADLVKCLRSYANCPTGSIHLLGKVVGYPRGKGWFTFYGNPKAEGRDIREFLLKRLYRMHTALAKIETLSKPVLSAVHRYIIKVIPTQHRKPVLIVKDRSVQAYSGMLNELRNLMPASNMKLARLCSQYSH